MNAALQVDHTQLEVIFNNQAFGWELDIDEVELKAMFKRLARVITSQGRASYTYTGFVDFKQRFAHQCSRAMFEALTPILCDQANAKGLVFLDAHGEPVHYVHQLDISGCTYYVDAYGVFSDIHAIKSRYGNAIASVQRYSKQAQPQTTSSLFDDIDLDATLLKDTTTGYEHRYSAVAKELFTQILNSIHLPR